MVVLQNILEGVQPVVVHGDLSMSIDDLCIDSRKVMKGCLFIAMRGVQTDGHQFIESAIAQGAVGILCEKLPEQLHPGIGYVEVKDSADACGIVASNYYDNPSSKLKLVGVTGTNGKTTIATLLFKLFRKLGYSCGLMSTIQNEINDQAIVATHTTPDAIHFNALLADMVKAGCDYAFAEVSSHAIHQKRIAGLHFKGGIFSNITHDHLDYHKTFSNYLKAKKAFFDDLPSDAFALTNVDDRNGEVMLQNTVAHKCSYGLKKMADYRGKILENNLTGLVMSIEEKEVHFRLTGRFNAYNLLAVYGSAIELGEEKSLVLEKLSSIIGAEGRFEVMISPREHIIGIVDYAHTPDALQNVLETINESKESGQQLITVVGCGGDRDKTKRPEMAQVAVQGSDKTVFTSDNPRSEDPNRIIEDMKQGVEKESQEKILAIADRREAMKVACTLAKSKDILLIAGRGHEPFQKIKGEKIHFKDKNVLTEIFEELNK